MKICGLQKTTLLDYPGHVAATVFLGGCNFRCPFCHNSDLITGDCEPACTEEELMQFFKKRRPILEGVCITGGEPTLQPELERLIRDIRELGYAVKLDTNGYRPDVLKDLAGKHLLDYVAMDIKSSRERYGAVAGVPGLMISRIEESVDFLLGGSIPYEFRTTVVKELHTEEDLCMAAQWLQGCSQYFLQNYEASEQVLQPGFSSYSPDELSALLAAVRRHIPHAQLRGVDMEL